MFVPLRPPKPKRCTKCGARTEDIVICRTKRINSERVAVVCFCNECLSEFEYERPLIPALDIKQVF